MPEARADWATLAPRRPIAEDSPRRRPRLHRVLFLGGNGHAAARLAGARAALGATGEFRLIEAPYPGFESRPRAGTLEQFLDLAVPPGDGEDVALVYATGIGALIALALRARGRLDAPLVLQGPVLWGLERRWLPRLLPVAPLRVMATGLVRSRVVQRWLWARHLRAPAPPRMIDALRAGYRTCGAFPDLFRWCTPALLRDLERRFAENPRALTRIEVWVGDRDRVVDGAEATAAMAALHVAWTIRRFPEWGHYPMIDDPAGWIRQLQHAVAAAPALP